MDNYQLLPKLLVRTPLLPLQTMFVTNIDVPLLKKIYSNTVILEALFLASPGLHLECTKFLRNEIHDEKETNKIMVALLKYLSRMSCRCTPFGLFAGYNLADWSNETNLVLDSFEKNYRHTRLDMHYLCALAKEVAANAEIQSLLKFYPNSSIYEFNNSFRYVEGKYTDTNISYEISQIQKTPALVKTLERAREGAYLPEIAHALVDNETSLDEVLEFLQEVISNQLLVSELEPAITGVEFLEQILSTLEQYKEDTNSHDLTNLLSTLATAKSKIRELDQRQLGTSREKYEEVYHLLEPLKVTIDLKLLFQVDMIKRFRNSNVSNKIAGQIRRGITVLNALTQKLPIGNLSRFKDAFQERYENREMPLLQVLDNESGIGYLQVGDRSDIAPLIDDIFTPGKTDGPEVKWPPNPLLIDKYIHAIRDGSYEVELKDSDIKKNSTDWSDLPESIVVMGSLLGATNESPDGLIYFRTAATSSSAANLLGRFTHTDEEIDAFVKSITRHEQELNREKIIAEIVHLPQSRSGNVLLRTQLRKYEIPFLAKSSALKENQVTLQELMISIDRAGRIVLRSNRLNKEVVPRLSSAHNFGFNALPIYQFLCDMQSQDYRPGLSFSWERLGFTHKFRPRLRYANVIFERASWTFPISDISFLVDQKDNSRSAQVAQWMMKWKIPRYILVLDSDNELFIDLHDYNSLQVLRDNIKNKQIVNFSEFLFFPENCIVSDITGNGYTNEFIMGFIKKKSDNKSSIPQTFFRPEVRIRRTFSVGSEWLFYKVYTGLKTADVLLTETFVPIINELRKGSLITKWFFTRYYDPKYHLRIRFRLVDATKVGNVITKLNMVLEPLLEVGAVSNIQADTYVREIERYGQNSVEIIEDIFYQQSFVVTEFLRLTENETDQESLRLLFGMKLIDMFLTQFGFDHLEKKKFCENALKEFEVEFNANATTRQQLGLKYKKYEKRINEVFIDSKEELTDKWIELNKVLTANKESFYENISKIVNLKSIDELEVDYNQVIWSLNHMLVNKLSRSKSRKHEFLFYALLTRHYSFTIAMSKVQK